MTASEDELCVKTVQVEYSSCSPCAVIVCCSVLDAKWHSVSISFVNDN